ncbi:fungal-specific transcription factor domain-containing protein [Limtongia smithiae]|uniref:fungal-specific transcription factor domain-containing protein n=1 Tax=Limtongia smithiae TaxID=1125753 RepID=UPI0034CF1431
MPHNMAGVVKPYAPDKPKQSKSRNGCATCKAKRLKCDETKPSCLQCQKRRVECGGYKRDFKWRLFEESSMSKRRATSSATTPTATAAPTPVVIATAKKPTVAPASARTTSDHASDIQPLKPETSSAVDSLLIFPEEIVGIGTLPVSVAETAAALFPDDANTLFSTPPELTFTPSEQFSPFNESSMQLATTPSSPVAIYSNMLREHSLSHLNETIIALRSHPLNLLAPELILSTDVDHKSEGAHRIDPTGAISPADIMMLPSMPSLDPFTRTALFFHTATASVMSMNDTPAANPWRTLFWPLARQFPALYHGLAAMSSFHAAASQQMYRIEGVEHMRMAISELVTGLNNNMPTDVALATTLTLAFAEAWDRHISTGIAHLRGARILIRQFVSSRRGLPDSVRKSAMERARLTRFKTLYNAFMYVAVIAQLTSDDEDETGGPVADDENAVFADAEDDCAPVDPLMGCAQTLFPIIGKVATLVRRVRLSGRDDIYVAGAIALRKELENWTPSVTATSLLSEDSAFDRESCVATAESYKCATLLYLFQCVPSLAMYGAPKFSDSSLLPTLEPVTGGDDSPALTPTQQISARLLQLLASIPTSSRTCIVHIFPLLSIACEVDSPSLRAIARQRWMDLSRLLQMGNVDRAFDVVQEVWRRKDLLKSQWKWKVGCTHWSTVMREWHWEVFLG